MTIMNAPQFRIATYNLQKCVGLDLRRRPGRSLGVINALGADLVVLQEVDKRLPPRPAALPHDMLEEDGWQVLPFGQPGGSLGWHGNAMLLRGNTRIRATAHLELPGLEPRGTTCVRCVPVLTGSVERVAGQRPLCRSDNNGKRPERWRVSHQAQ